VVKGQSNRPARSSEVFFINAMKNHLRVTSICGSPESPQIFIVKRHLGDELIIYLIDVYTLGMADFLWIRSAHPSVNCIVTASAWNSYTSDAKAAATEARIGLFDIRECMGALHDIEFWKYVRRPDSERNDRRPA
jgi:hypothetical protein